MPSHLSFSLASLSSVLFCSWNVPTSVYLFECVCPSIIFPAQLPAECWTVWINETELTGLLMKACLHTLHFLWSLCTWELLGVDFYIWVFVVLLIKASGNGLVFENQAFLIPNSSLHASSSHLPLPPPPFFLLLCAMDVASKRKKKLYLKSQDVSSTSVDYLWFCVYRELREMEVDE